MPFIPSFYSASGEGGNSQVAVYYHNNSACPKGMEIAASDRMPSTGGHHLCEECSKLNSKEAMQR